MKAPSWAFLVASRGSSAEFGDLRMAQNGPNLVVPVASR